MTFDRILEDGRLWAVRYDGEGDNCFENLFSQWYDMQWLKSFFNENLPDLDLLFRHLESSRFSEMVLGKEKARGDGYRRHSSWLRIYAIKLERGIYLVTGGAIKLTATMAERSHTLSELAKMELVRNYLIDNCVFDNDGLIELIGNE